jgi:hypothetical protein
LTMKAEAPGSDGGGISTGATIGIIVAGIVLLFGIAFVVVKVLRYWVEREGCSSWKGVGKGRG